jgi:hypothetical protein
MSNYKRFSVSVRKSGKVIANEKRRKDIEKKIIKPFEVMKIKADNMTQFYQILRKTFGEFSHHRRHNNWVINFDNNNFKGEKEFIEIPNMYGAVETTVEEEVEESS